MTSGSLLESERVGRTSLRGEERVTPSQSLMTPLPLSPESGEGWSLLRGGDCCGRVRCTSPPSLCHEEGEGRPPLEHPSTLRVRGSSRLGRSGTRSYLRLTI